MTLMLPFLIPFLIILCTLSLLLQSGCAFATCAGFTAMSECFCLGQTLSYECTTEGPISTVWQGSAFQCVGNRIVLRHSQFTSLEGATGECNSGLVMIAGHSLRVEGDCYTSQLNITVSSSLNSQTVECAYSGGETSVVGSSTIDIMREYPAPSNVHLVGIQPGYLAFSWSPVPLRCETIQYNIIARNCDIICPSSTSHHTITCTGGGSIAQDRPCMFTFAVQTVVCGDTLGNTSNSVSVVLKGPSAPTVQCEPLYSADTGSLTSITTLFEEVESFTISGELESLVASYTITYTESTYGGVCGLATVLASSCVDGICSHTFDVSSSSCPPLSNINVTVFGRNQLGNGSISHPVTVGSVNRHFGIKFDLLTSTVHCLFTSQQPSGEKHCIIEYSPEENTCTPTLYKSEITGNSSATHSLIIDLPQLPYSQSNRYCYIITARNGTLTVKVEGLFHAGCDPHQLSDGTPLPTSVRCGAPLHSLGISNGVVCYNGVDTGAVAVYSCFSCASGISTVKSPSVRTCLQNGSWNGMIPRCEIQCGTGVLHDDKHLWPFLSVSLMGVVIAAIIATFIIITFILVRAKSKVQEELKQCKASALYDEIGIPPSIIDSNKNVAYISTMERVEKPT